MGFSGWGGGARGWWGPVDGYKTPPGNEAI